MGHQNQNLKLENAEDIPIRSIPRKRDYKPVSVNTQMDELVAAAMTQNFVPVLDDKKELYRFGKAQCDHSILLRPVPGGGAHAEQENSDGKASVVKDGISQDQSGADAGATPLR